jgi:hypothetical protein
VSLEEGVYREMPAVRRLIAMEGVWIRSGLEGKEGTGKMIDGPR